jgi:hypothetical protein
MSHQCPTCRDKFETIAGMKRHHALKHGESISGEIQECEYCGNSTRVRPCRTNLENTCSESCQNKLHSQRMEGSDPDRIECDMCGEIFVEYESQRTGDKSFCSKECYHEYRSTFIRGPDHPNWSGGQDYNYTNGWKEISDLVRNRDGKCVICGAGIDEHIENSGRKPDVHHIIPSVAFTGNNGDFLLNLITTCRSCHRKIEDGKWEIEPEVLLSLATYTDT